MRGKYSITVVSTRSTDILVDERGNTINIQPGGPALFISRALDAASFSYRLICGPKLTVHLQITPAGELGKIKKPIHAPLTLPAIRTDAMLLSTIVNEWPISWSEFSGRQFIDIQGFVRDARLFGKKKKFSWGRLHPWCIKATENEIACIPPQLVQAQKKERLLIITRGSRGSITYERGKKYMVKPRIVLLRSHMIGAGDTFFAHFVAEYLISSNVRRSVERATERTVAFLKKG